MISRNTLQFLTILVAASAIPAIGCLGYYTLDSFGESGKTWATWIILAYPLALIGLLATIAAFLSAKRTIWKILTASLLFIMPAAFLITIKW